MRNQILAHARPARNLGAMRFDEFDRAARRAYDDIPEEYLEGVTGLVVSREALPDPALPEVFTLGHCLTEDHPSGYEGPTTTRSTVVLYWGSFRAMAEADPDFDWEGELWETLTHELRHHLESLARDDGLEGLDYAVEETFNRKEGLDFDPWYYQRGEVVSEGVFRVESDVYIEQVWREEDFQASEEIEFGWDGSTYRITRPESLGDLHYIWIHGVDPGPAALELVLVRRSGAWDRAKRWFGDRRPVIYESEAEARQA
jgi:predicted Zn-dependent protease with MMP-like domain